MHARGRAGVFYLFLVYYKNYLGRCGNENVGVWHVNDMQKVDYNSLFIFQEVTLTLAGLDDVTVLISCGEFKRAYVASLKIKK